MHLAFFPSRVAPWSVLGLVLLGLAAFPSRASAQTYDCERLRQEIATAGRPDGQRAEQFARALQRQRSDLGRTQAYADRLGCSRGFFGLGSSGPPQCDGLLSQVDRLSSNLDSLSQQAAQDQGDAPARQAALAEQYRAYCGVAPSDADLDNGMRSGFGDLEADPDDRPRRYGKAICVKTCDGGFFPLSFAPADRAAGGLQNLCSALCPNTEVKLYTTPEIDNIGAAVSIEGAAYTDLPAAFKFQKSFDPACTCKPPGKSWVEALADAEKLLDATSKDVTVTAKMSDAMARPTAPGTPVPPTSKKKGFDKTQIKALLEAQAAAEGALGAVGAQAPTASTDSAGIGNGAPTTHVVGTDEGQVKTQSGPNGATRRVRIVGPAL